MMKLGYKLRKISHAGKFLFCSDLSVCPSVCLSVCPSDCSFVNLCWHLSHSKRNHGKSNEFTIVGGNDNNNNINTPKINKEDHEILNTLFGTSQRQWWEWDKDSWDLNANWVAWLELNNKKSSLEICRLFFKTNCKTPRNRLGRLSLSLNNEYSPDQEKL